MKRRPLSRHLLVPREMRIPLTEIERGLFERFQERYRAIQRVRGHRLALRFYLLVAFWGIVGAYIIHYSAQHLPQAMQNLVVGSVFALPLMGFERCSARKERRLRRRALRYAGVPECRRCGRLVASYAARCGFCKAERETRS